MDHLYRSGSAGGRPKTFVLIGGALLSLTIVGASPALAQSTAKAQAIVAQVNTTTPMPFNLPAQPLETSLKAVAAAAGLISSLAAFS